MKAKMTAGPWSFGCTGTVMQGYSQPYAIGQSGVANLIAGVFGDVRGGKDVAQANAVAIAAVPDLIAALQKSAQRIEQLCSTVNTLSNLAGLGDKVRADDFVDIARAAIAKATGADKGMT